MKIFDSIDFLQIAAIVLVLIVLRKKARRTSFSDHVRSRNGDSLRKGSTYKYRWPDKSPQKSNLSSNQSLYGNKNDEKSTEERVFGPKNQHKDLF